MYFFLQEVVMGVGGAEMQDWKMTDLKMTRRFWRQSGVSIQRNARNAMNATNCTNVRIASSSQYKKKS